MSFPTPNVDRVRRQAMSAQEADEAARYIEALQVVYNEAKQLVDSLDEEKVLRAGCWAGVDLQPLCDLLDGPSPADFSAALEMLEDAQAARESRDA